MTRRILLAGALLLACRGAQIRAETAPPPPPGTIQQPAETIRWTDAPPTMPAGAKIALLEGHPQQAAPFTMRIKAPAGTKLPPHTHPREERVTVLSGAIFVGFGETFDKGRARRFSAGSFYVNPPEVPHFIFMEEETVFQITGQGPWEVRPLRRK